MFNGTELSFGHMKIFWQRCRQYAIEWLNTASTVYVKVCISYVYADYIRYVYVMYVLVKHSQHSKC